MLSAMKLNNNRFNLWGSVVVYLISTHVQCKWMCPDSSSFCFQWIDGIRSWNGSRSLCASFNGEIPSAQQLQEFIGLTNDSKNNQQHSVIFWTSLCFNGGRIQWFADIPYEERDLAFIDQLLSDVSFADVNMNDTYCYYFTEEFGNKQLKLERSDRFHPTLCTASQKSISQSPGSIAFQSNERILSVTVTSESPNRHSLQLRCQVEMTDPNLILNYQWIRNGGYMGVGTQTISLGSEEEVLPWIGSVQCRVWQRGLGPQKAVISHQEFHLVLSKTATLKMTTNCRSCSIEGLFNATKIILTQFVEIEVAAGAGRTVTFYYEPPLIERSTFSLIIHLRNLAIDSFDFKLVAKLGSRFELSTWAKDRSLFVPNGSDLTLFSISPRHAGAMTPDGNAAHRNCSISNRFQDCRLLQVPRKETFCFQNFYLIKNQCYRVTENVAYSEGLSQCWSGWQMNAPPRDESLAEWVQSVKDMVAERASYKKDLLIWLPARRFNLQVDFENPSWKWNAEGNKWIEIPPNYKNAALINDTSHNCAAYSLAQDRIVGSPCNRRLPMICHRDSLQSDHVQPILTDDKSFCPPGWVTHPLVLDSGVCFRRFRIAKPLDWDTAQEQCACYGGRLATAETQPLRIVLDQILHHFNNQSGQVHSWIGLRQTNIGMFRWVNVSSSFKWRSFEAPRNGYGVSAITGDSMSSTWWNWPRYVKQPAFVCQKTMSTDWNRQLRLHLVQLTGRQIVVTFHYTPPPMTSRGVEGDATKIDIINVVQPPLFRRKWFWLPEFDVVCQVARHAINFHLPSGYQRLYSMTLTIPASVPSGMLSCEAWINQPAFRFQSNSIAYQTPGSLTYVVRVERKQRIPTDSGWWFPNHLVDDLTTSLARSNLARKVFQPLIDWRSVTTVVDQGHPMLTHSKPQVYYRLSLLVSKLTGKPDLASEIARCSATRIDPEWISMEEEALLLLLMQKCLPLVYDRKNLYRFISASSAATCLEELGGNGQFIWPKTAAGSITRSRPDCLVASQQFVHRRCLDDFHRGPRWSPVLIAEGNISHPIVCHDMRAETGALRQLEALSFRSSAEISSMLRQVLQHLGHRQLSVGDVEITTRILRRVSPAPGASSSVNMQLAVDIFNRVLEQGRTSLKKLLPETLENFLQLLSDVPEKNRGQKVHFNRIHQVSIVAESLTLRDQLFINSQLSPLALNTSSGTLLVPINFENFGGKSNLMTTMTILPADLLVPTTKSAEIFTVEYAGGKFQPDGDSLIRVEIKTNPKTTRLSSPLTLFFRPSTRASMQFQCFQWNSGRWMTGDCWYLGRHNDSEVCQCISGGIYALFRKHERKLDVTFYISDIISVALAVLTICGLMASLLVARFRKSDHLVAVALLLQTAIAWLGILMSCVTRQLFRGVVCFSLSILFQYFLVVSLLLAISLVMHEHVGIDRLGSSEKSYLLKASLFAWGVASIIFIVAPILRWEFLFQNKECWIVDGSEFWLMIAFISVLSVISWILKLRNYHKRWIRIGLEFNLKDFFQLIHALLMPMAAVSAVLDNSINHHSPLMSAVFSASSSLWCASLLINSWPTPTGRGLRKPCNTNRDFQLKTVRVSSNHNNVAKTSTERIISL